MKQRQNIKPAFGCAKNVVNTSPACDQEVATHCHK